MFYDARLFFSLENILKQLSAGYFAKAFLVYSLILFDSKLAYYTLDLV